MPLVEIVILGLVLGPILEESFFRGCLLPVLAHTVGKSFAVVLTALLFALFHGPANLAHWAWFAGTGVAYGWIRVTLRSTTARPSRTLPTIWLFFSWLGFNLTRVSLRPERGRTSLSRTRPRFESRRSRQFDSNFR